MNFFYCLLTTILILDPLNTFSQVENEGYKITWANGNITLLKDLGKVDLHLKNGKVIGKVIIHRINEEKEIIEYEKNKTMHDLPFRAFKHAQNGRFSISILYLDPSNKLAIKPNPEFNYGEGINNFSVSYYEKKIREKERVCKSDSTTSINSLSYGKNDTLIRKSEIIPITLIELTPELIRFKRRDIIDGPTYIVSRNRETQIHQFKNYVKIYINQ